MAFASECRAYMGDRRLARAWVKCADLDHDLRLRAIQELGDRDRENLRAVRLVTRMAMQQPPGVWEQDRIFINSLWFIYYFFRLPGLPSG